jgi:PAS domain S-box-containing protein
VSRRATRPESQPADDSAELRRRAESSLGKRKPGAARPRTDAESLRLLHEIEVHRVELELQNAELRGARDELEAALATYTDLYDFAPVGYVSVGEKGQILEVNLAGAALLGTERAQLSGRNLQKFVDPASRPTLQAFLLRLFERPEKQDCEVALRRADGSRVWASLQGAASDSLRAGRRWCRVAVSDITALKQAWQVQLRADALAARNEELSLEIARRQRAEQDLKESERRQAALLAQSRLMQEQLRHLSHGILHANEQERKRISRELHDYIAQAAVGINLHLQLLTREATGDTAAGRKRIATMKRSFTDFVDVVHRFSKDLRPTLLDDLGLIPALESFTREFGQRTGLHVRLTSAATAERLDADRKIVLFRVVQEALSNVARHAHARRVDVRIDEQQGLVRLEVADDGKGFDVERALYAKRNRRLGLLGMRERVEMVGGSFSIDSAPRKGTCVRAQLSLAPGLRVARDGSSRVSAGSRRPPDQPQQHDQHDGADRRDEDAAAQAAADGHAELAEEEPAQQRAQHADDDVAQDAEAAALHQLAREPARDQADQDEPQEVRRVAAHVVPSRESVRAVVPSAHDARVSCAGRPVRPVLRRAEGGGSATPSAPFSGRARRCPWGGVLRKRARGSTRGRIVGAGMTRAPRVPRSGGVRGRLSSARMPRTVVHASSRPAASRASCASPA